MAQVSKQEYVQAYKDHWMSDVNSTLIQIGDKCRDWRITQMISATTSCLGGGLNILCNKGAFELEDPTPELVDLCERHLYARLKLHALASAEQYFAKFGGDIDWINLLYAINDMAEVEFDCNGIGTIALDFRGD